nr:replication protein A 70 kDa DNA-binding subunit B-like [Ipomoea batatas]
MHIPGKSVSIVNDFVEGNVYCIKNFLVVAHFYSYKTCHGEYMMKSYAETLVKDYKGCDFPRNMYRLQPFESLKTVDSTVLVDVIGRVVEIYSLFEKMISGRPSLLIDFLIEDLNYGTTSGGDLSSSKIQITTLSEIFVKREIGAFWVPCKIISIESDPNDWYYDSCPSQGCNTKSDFNAGMYDCGKCGDRFFKGFFFSKDDVESPIATTSEKQNVAGNENEAVKRSMLDEFSSTQTSKKKKQIVVKEEKEHTGE